MESTKFLAQVKRRHDQELELMRLVDDMASAASDMNAQNYEILLQTRQQFKEKLHAAMQETSKELPFAY